MKEKPIYEQFGYTPDPPFYATTSTPIVTNYDRIIRKTPEELAEFLSPFAGCRRCPIGCNKYENNCVDIWIDWLKEEATE